MNKFFFSTKQVRSALEVYPIVIIGMKKPIAGLQGRTVRQQFPPRADADGLKLRVHFFTHRFCRAFAKRSLRRLRSASLKFFGIPAASLPRAWAARFIKVLYPCNNPPNMPAPRPREVDQERRNSPCCHSPLSYQFRHSTTRAEPRSSSFPFSDPTMRGGLFLFAHKCNALGRIIEMSTGIRRWEHEAFLS